MINFTAGRSGTHFDGAVWRFGYDDERHCCAADVLWGTALTRMTGFGLVEAVLSIKSYVDRWNARPSVKKVAQIDADLLKVQGNPAS
jgi:hypothetical protein